MTGVINRMAQNPAKWLAGDGEEPEIIISCRVRLARNLHNTRFMGHADRDEQKKVLDSILNACAELPVFEHADYFDFTALDELDRSFFVERRLASTEFAETDWIRGLLVGQDESISLMINEEDHLRIQSLYPGLSFTGAWQAIHDVDRALSGRLEYAFSEQFGYLTACPSNVGTGVRFSVFIHLPALIFLQQADRLFADAIPAGLAVRGFYGEGSKSMGNCFQISNQYTLGYTEQGILDRIEKLIKNFIVKEKEARSEVLSKQRLVIEDRISRSIGLITHARMLSYMEALEALSTLRLGVDLGLIPEIPPRVFNTLTIQTQPLHLQKIENRILDLQERDVLRARVVRESVTLSPMS